MKIADFRADEEDEFFFSKQEDPLSYIVSIDRRHEAEHLINRLKDEWSSGIEQARTNILDDMRLDEIEEALFYNHFDKNEGTPYKMLLSPMNDNPFIDHIKLLLKPHPLLKVVPSLDSGAFYFSDKKNYKKCDKHQIEGTMTSVASYLLQLQDTIARYKLLADSPLSTLKQNDSYEDTLNSLINELHGLPRFFPFSEVTLYNIDGKKLPLLSYSQRGFNSKILEKIDEISHEVQQHTEDLKDSTHNLENYLKNTYRGVIFREEVGELPFKRARNAYEELKTLITP